MLSRLHEGHLGIEKCRARTREIMYWPNMCADIEETVAQCATCETFRRQNNKQPIIPHEIPDRPWAKVGADIFSFKDHDYLVVVDYFSKFPEVEQVTCKIANGVISVLRQIFARHGIPETMICDNMPFLSHLMAGFATEMGFEIVTSSPRYALSNGKSNTAIPAIPEYCNYRSAVLACSILNESATERQNAEYIEHTETSCGYRRQINPEMTINASKALLRPGHDDTRTTSNWIQCMSAPTQHVGPHHRHWRVRHPEVVRRHH